MMMTKLSFPALFFSATDTLVACHFDVTEDQEGDLHLRQSYTDSNGFDQIDEVVLNRGQLVKVIALLEAFRESR